MTRYQVLRQMGVGPFSSGFVSFFNWLFDAPANEIHFMNVVIEFDPKEHK